MKLTKKERAIVAIMHKYAGDVMTMDDLMAGYGSAAKKIKHPRQSMFATVRVLLERLRENGVHVARTNSLGRGKRGAWAIPQDIPDCRFVGLSKLNIDRPKKEKK